MQTLKLTALQCELYEFLTCRLMFLFLSSALFCVETKPKAQLTTDRGPGRLFSVPNMLLR